MALVTGPHANLLMLRAGGKEEGEEGEMRLISFINVAIDRREEEIGKRLRAGLLAA